MLKTFIPGENNEDSIKKINYIFAFSLIWGLSASMDSKYYEKIDVVFKDIFTNLRFPRS